MIITRTPLRISFLGGNTDFRKYYRKYGGLVVTTSIDKYVYCIVKRRFDELIVINYSIKEIVKNVNQLKHELVREAMKLVGVDKGIEISFMADVPAQGTGLGSSSAVTIGVLNALHTYVGENVDSSQLAVEAIKIELDILKKPIGVQDQYIIAYGGLRAIALKTNDGVSNKKIVLNDGLRNELSDSLMLFYTGITRHTDEILATINISKNRKLLDQNKLLARKGFKALEKGDLNKFGRLLNQYWEIKKRLSSRISNKKIELMYRKAMDAGSLGGKIVGAGGGGFLLVLVAVEKKKAVKNALRSYKELPFSLSESGSVVIFNSYK